MTNRRPGWRRALLDVAFVLLVAGIGGGLIWLVRVTLTDGLQVAAAWAQLASLVLAAAAVINAIVVWRRRVGPGTAAAPTADQLDHAHRTLASLVLGQWRDEILVRQLDDPTPLAVRWRLTELPVMDHHDHVFRPSPLRTLLRRGRPRFVGRTDRMGELAGEFRRLARRRLVILGGPGMGKTTLAVLLLRELLRRHEPAQPVPVLLSMSDWRSGEEPLHGWLARRVAETYPALRAPDFGSDVVGTMVAQGRILPVLDGLDELPERTRSAALTALNAAATADDALILTCRTTEYEAAISRPGGTVLTGGAVVEPEPLQPGDVTAYLIGCLRRRPGSGWRNLLSTLTDRTAPVARALTTPLDLWLLRRVYIDTGTDPGELLDARRFPTATEITDHLLDHLVRAAITATPPHLTTDQPSASRPRHSWDPDAVKRWLSFLAAHLTSTGARDIVWWRLYRTEGVRLPHRLMAGVPLGLAFGSVAGPAAALGGEFSAKPMTGFTAGLVGGLAAGPIVGLVAGLTARPAHANLRLRGRVRALGRKLTDKLAVGVAIGLSSVVAGEFGPTPFPALLEFGLTAGLAFAVLASLLEWVSTPLPGDLAQTPPSTLHRDLQLMAGRTITTVVVGGFLGGLTTGLLGGSMVKLVLGVEGILAVLLLFLPARRTVTATASSVYLCTVTVLSIQRRIPRQMMRFLDDAHRAGLLRQVGPVYQFRHAKLQDRLAHTYARTHRE